MVGAGRIAALPLPDRRTSLHWAVVAGVAGLLSLVAVGAASAPAPIGPLLVLVAAAPFVAMIVGSLRRLLLAAVIVDIPFQWDVHLFYRPAEAELGAIGGLGLSVTTIALAGLYALWLAEALVSPQTAASGRLRASLPLAAYVVLTALSLLAARDPALAAFEVALLVQTLFLFVYVASTVRSHADVRFVTIVLLGTLLVQALAMLAMRYSSLDLSRIGLSSNPQPGSGPFADRVTGTVGSPNTAASYLVPVLLPAVTLLAASVSRRLKALALLAFAFGLAALVLTFSRGGWVGFALGSALAFVAARRRGWLSGRAWLAVAVGAAVLATLFGATIASRLTTDDRGAAYSRVPLMKLAGEVIRDEPLLGVGPNNFAFALPEFAGPDFTYEWLYTVHNKYLLVWAETGLAALLAFLAFLVVTLRRGWRCWQGHDPFMSPLALGLTAGVVGTMAHMTVEIFNTRAQVQLVCLVAALLAAMAALEARGTDRRAETSS
jgi:O-antigen ligase